MHLAESRIVLPRAAYEKKLKKNLKVSTNCDLAPTHGPGTPKVKADHFVRTCDCQSEGGHHTLDLQSWGFNRLCDYLLLSKGLKFLYVVQKGRVQPTHGGTGLGWKNADIARCSG